ncbi:MAG: hypothetical protein FJZ00_02535, partial [Candidatus Sericytochromatia bacterium]|nr:hypothetical protein [Candidatus Tanganyikabacteria bacterium]
MRCSGCRQPIASGRFVRAGNLAFHGPCFVCAECGSSLERYMVHRNRFYCVSCHAEAFAQRCKICALPISGTYVEHEGGQVHEKCYH